MKAEPQYVEGPEAWERFQNAMKGILAAPHDEIQRRIEEHRKEAARNPHRRGPKRKAESALALEPPRIRQHEKRER